MSENIQSIANGTFVLGQTSATNFVGGPGISITQPSEGTVRIANDETVLYKSTANSGTAIQEGSYITLSESMKNFEMTKIYYSLQNSWAGAHEFVCYNVTGDLKINFRDTWYREQAGFNNWYETLTYNKYTDSDLKFSMTGGVQRPILSTSWATTAGLNTTIYKIVGINRKENT